MSVDTWAVVVATAVGPLAAVLITRWLETRREAELRRHWVFTVLMGLRGVIANAEHVRALNVVQVHFYKDEKVITAWKRFVEHTETKASDEKGWIEWNLKQRELLNGMLSEIAVALDIPIDSVDLRRGGYAPQAWADREAGEQDRLFVFQALAASIRAGEWKDFIKDQDELKAAVTSVLEASKPTSPSPGRSKK